ADEPGMRKVRWKVLVESHGGVTALYIGAVETIIQEASKEREQLQNKMRTIEDGGYVPGDLGFVCGLAIGATVGLALAQLYPAAGLADVLAAYACKKGY